MVQLNQDRASRGKLSVTNDSDPDLMFALCGAMIWEDSKKLVPCRSVSQELVSIVLAAITEVCSV